MSPARRKSRKNTGSGLRRIEGTRQDVFPPLSTSLEAFLDDGSDKRFRDLIYKVLSISSLMLQSRDCFAAFMGVSGPQYSMMVAIGESGAATVGQIAEKLRVSSPFVTAEVGKLIRRGILSRRPNQKDRRSSLLVLTRKGRDLIVKVGPLRRMTNDIIFGSLTKEQALAIHSIMDKLVVDSERALYEIKSPSLRRKIAF
jgi:DNA-binding MarR family transcriptional regulator